MRKAAIILTALVVTALAYWGYLWVSGSEAIAPPASLSGHDLEPSKTTTDAQRIGSTTIQGAETTYYVMRDPITKRAQRAFGFSKLANPGQSVRWQVEKPYLIFYESAFQCRVDADNGLFQMERAGSAVSPKDGQLDGSVVIHLKPRPGSPMAETRLYLDDLLFSSERTEFSTDGPVRMVSSQVEMSGRGLVLLLNAQDSQVEYLQILELESLRLKDFVRADKTTLMDTSPAAAPSADGRTAAAMTPVPETLETTTPPAASVAAAPAKDADAAPSRLYQCTLQDNVMIRYGDQLVVAGAEQVSIQNIVMSNPQDPESSPADKPASSDPSTTTETDAAPEQVDELLFAASEDPRFPETETPRDDSGDVIVTCDGGIVLKLMPQTGAASSPTAMAVEMNGTPLRIEQVDPLFPDKTQPLAHCGSLRYDMAEEVLRLFKMNGQGDILLGGGSSAGRIETQGPVVWDRKANHAQIAGPGTVYFKDAEDPRADEDQVAFAGQMELFFADLPAEESDLHLTAVNLTGGMSARLNADGGMKTAAESARLTFGPENALTSAKLEGSVKFENTDPQSPSNAAAHTAVFHFDDRRQLAGAELTGDVRFASDGGRLQADAAKIAFAVDEAGAVQPVQFNTVADAVLETVDASSILPPARFEAKKISYDLLTGSGRATGPVRFVFYQQADPNSGLLTDAWPVEITADGDAEFIAGDSRQIESVVFNQSVKGVRTQQFAAFTQTDTFGADKMVVTLGRSAEGATDIQQITLSDGDVYAESIRAHETLKLAHTRLSCRQIVYDRRTEGFIAAGPGQIDLDNSKAEPAASSDGSPNLLSGPSFAQLKGFDRIEWSAADQRIVADGGANLIELAYFPLVNGVPDKDIRAAAGRVEIDFASASDGKTQIAKLTAKDRVYFEERGKNILEGYTLVYDAGQSGWLSITGTDDRPCMANGARVPYIHYNMLTGDLETRLSTIPGAVPLP